IGPFGSRMKSDCYVSEGVRVVRGTNLNEGRTFRGEFVFITEEKAKSLGSSMLQPYDLVFPHRGSIGEVGIVPDDGLRYVMSTSLMKLTCDQSKARPDFLYYFFRSDIGRHALLQNQSQVGTPGIGQPLTSLKSITIRLPDLVEQDAVAALLRTLDGKIEILKKTNETIEAIAQAIFKSWFVDFDPVRAKVEGRDPEGMDAETAALFPSAFENSDLGSIPQGWKAVPFGALLESAIGGDWGKEEPDEVHTEQVAIIRGTDMPTIQAGFTSGIPVRFVSAKKLQSRKLRDSDIIIEVSGGSPKQPTGRSIFVSDALLEQLSIPAVPASFCRLFRATNPRVGLLLSQHLSHIYGEGKMWGYQNQSTGISNFQTKHFLESEYVCLPSDEVLDAFQQIVRPLIDKQQLKIASTLADLRDTLLPRLISGKLRVPEAEAMLMEVM
ncbi:MAG TPA: restriction endonuclease subunit S, partial [Terracidiphilus sp.]